MQKLPGMSHGGSKKLLVELKVILHCKYFPVVEMCVCVCTYGTCQRVIDRESFQGEGPRPVRAGGAPQLSWNDRCFSAERSVS